MIKKKLIIFDLDGVLFDSINNMKISWEFIKVKYRLKASFDNYIKHLGLPFEKILENLGINSDHSKLKNLYKFTSEKNLDLIVPFNYVLSTLDLLIKKNIRIAICTSKDLYRTKKILDKYFLKFDSIQADTKGKKNHKPEPDQILRIINKLEIEKKHSVYIGDTLVDYLTAKNANIDYLHAGWGYGTINRNVTMLNSINEILNYI